MTGVPLAQAHPVQYIYVRHKVGWCAFCGNPILDSGHNDDPDLWEHAWTPPRND